MQPTPGDVWVSRPLTNISLATVQNEANFIATQAFPIIGVANQTGMIWRYSDSDFLRDEAQLRAPGTESAGGGFNVDHSISYACQIKAFHKDIDDPTRANADSVLMLDTAATKFATQKMLISREVQWASTFFQSGVWANNFQTPSNLWDTANSTPKADVEVGKQTILAATGFEPNTLILGYRVYSSLRNNKDVRSQFQYTSADSIDEDMLAGYFGVDKVLVSKAILATNAEGGTLTTNFISGDNALLVYADPAPSLMSLTAGITLAWSGYLGAVDGFRVKRFRMENIASDRIELEMAQDMKCLVPRLGYFFEQVVST